MTDINIFKLDGKPITKLIEVVSKGIGTLYKPTAIRKKADAEAYRIGILEKAKSKAKAERKEIELEIFERAENRLLHRELLRQQNIEEVIQIAGDQLNQEESVSDDPVDDDWIARFFNIVQDISDKDVRNLWGRILSGEVKKPNSYSFRTMDTLRNISPLEAKLFMKFSKFVLIEGKNAFVFNTNKEGNFAHGGKTLLDEYEIPYSDLLILEDAGLIVANDVQLTINATDNSTAFVYGDYAVVFEAPEKSPPISTECICLTRAGYELVNLTEQSLVLEYLNQVAEMVKEKGMKVFYSEIDGFSESGVVINESEAIELPFYSEESSTETET
ncbi:MAG: DUF2806 domain-containing protein [Bacteroidales bacterium]|nr:DUF2806 domain-containing protein [Bacteroidales bacterium]